MKGTLPSSLTLILLSALILTGCAGEVSLTASGSSSRNGENPDADLDIGIGGGTEDGNQSSTQDQQNNQNTGRTTPTTPIYLVLAVILICCYRFELQTAIKE